MKKIRVMLVDDHEIFREGIRIILDQQSIGNFEIEVVGEAGTSAEATKLLSTLSVDIVILDLGLPDTDGVAFARKLLGETTPPKVLVLSGYSQTAYVRMLLGFGVAGFLFKMCTREDLYRALIDVMQGTLVIPQEAITRQQSGLFFQTEKPTSRELEVLQLVAQGYSNAQISKELVISERTVHFHMSNIMTKLNVSSRMEAVVRAQDIGWMIPQLHMR